MGLYEVNEVLRLKLREANERYLVMSTFAAIGWSAFVIALVMI